MTTEPAPQPSGDHLTGRERLTDLPLTGSWVDRGSDRRGPELLARLLAEPATQVLQVRAGHVLVRPADGDGPARPVLRSPASGDAEGLLIFLGRDRDGVDHLALDAGALPDDLDLDVVLATEPDAEPDTGLGSGAIARWQSLRQVASELTGRDAELVVQAVALTNWHAVHQHCPRCGAPTEPVSAGHVRRCPQDGSEHYPRTDPAVIMTVVDDDDRVLLGSHAGWPVGRFSTLAGFVEPGESLEAAVAREVHEEVGVVVDDAAYLGSQPWPFPASIMLGFRAHATSLAITVDGTEIREARWFTRAELAEQVHAGTVVLSPRLSISRALLEHWYGGPIAEPARPAW